MQNVNSIDKLFAYKIYLNMQKATTEAVTFLVRVDKSNVVFVWIGVVLFKIISM